MIWRIPSLIWPGGFGRVELLQITEDGGQEIQALHLGRSLEGSRGDSHLRDFINFGQGAAYSSYSINNQSS
jgi:hypothetical protein